MEKRGQKQHHPGRLGGDNYEDLPETRRKKKPLRKIASGKEQSLPPKAADRRKNQEKKKGRGKRIRKMWRESGAKRGGSIHSIEMGGLDLNDRILRLAGRKKRPVKTLDDEK